ncbi:cupin domain-containing protein [Streptomyces violaceusniger]|uniref:cupin domain-containing protein n=1 Tax=Streptomyces violaceusniger TaxID=68280 RepID=UPI003447CC18
MTAEHGGPSLVVFDGSAPSLMTEVVRAIPGENEGAAGLECATTVLSQSADGRTVTGIWRCEPCDWTLMETGERAEFFHVLEGSMVLCEEGGEPVEATAGMSVFSPPGWTGTWRVPSRLRKVFISFHPAQS